MSKETPLAEIYNDIANEIMGEPTRLIHFPHKWTKRFGVIQPQIGARIPIEVKDNQEIHVVRHEAVTNAILAWLRQQPDPEILLTHQQAKDATNLWQSVDTPLDQDRVKPVRWLSDPGYTWRRLPWDMEQGDTPTWDKIFVKLTNAPSFRQWLGSLFYEEGRQHQYVWVHGMGNDGKGAMNRFLKKVFGPSYRSKQPPSPNDKFWTYGLLGARLVVFPDCNSQKFTTGGFFKSLSGGDPVDVEAKGRMSFTTELNCKFLFFSNEKPNISCEDADMRRIIYCEFFEKTKEEDADPLFEEKLWGEGGAFLTKCVKEYTEKCPRHENIKSNQDDISDWISSNDERFQTFFDHIYEQPRNECYRTTKLLHALTDEQLSLVTLKPEDFLASLVSYFPDRRDQAAFRDWVYKKYGVQKKSIRRGRDVAHRYVGVMHKLSVDANDKRRRAVENLYKGFKLLSTPSTVDTLSD